MRDIYRYLLEYMRWESKTAGDSDMFIGSIYVQAGVKSS